MLELIRQMMEQEMGQKESLVLHQLFSQRLRMWAYYIITAVSTLLAFALSLVAVAWNIPKAYSVEALAILALILVILIAGEFLRTSERVTTRLARQLWQVFILQREQRATDFLAGHFQASLVLIVAPFAAFLMLFALGWNDRTPLPVDAIVSLAGWLLPAQIALFSFLFSHALGKYSSQLARVIITHRSVSLLQGYGLLALFLALVLKHYGCPRLCFDWMWLFYVSLFFCLIMTISVARKGVDSDRFVIYAGHHYARQLKRRIKRPILKQSPWARQCWYFAAHLGLDFRSLGRFLVFSESGGGGELCKRRLMALFNAAMKTVTDNQHESLQSCLYSIMLVMDTYATLRADYIVSTDSVYSYCNDQFAALIRAAEKSPNEYLVEEIVKAIGIVGQTSLRIKGLTDSTNEPEETHRYRKEHSLSSYWFYLLQETFGRLHLLQRSGAPGQVLVQLRDFAVRADDAGYPKVVVYSYLPAVESVLGLCLKHRDPFHQSLISRSLRDVLIVWHRNVSQHRDYLRNPAGIHHGTINLIRQAIESGAATRLPSAGMGNIPELLLYWTQPGIPIIQDVFMSITHRKVDDIHCQRDTVDGLKDVINLVSDLAIQFAKQGKYGGKYILEALYEIAFLVFEKLQPSFEPMHDPSYDNYPPQIRATLGQRDKDNPRRRLEEALFVAWRKAVPPVYAAEQHLIYEWEQDFFGFVGLAMCIHDQRKDKWLKDGIRDCVTDYLNLVKNELQTSHRGNLHNGNREYLQLCGAWVDHFLDLPDLAKEILNTVALLRCFDPPHGGGRYECLGYPSSLSVDDAFYLPPLRSIKDHITQQDWDTHKGYEQKLMTDYILFAYYEKVEAKERAMMADRDKASSTGDGAGSGN